MFLVKVNLLPACSALVRPFLRNGAGIAACDLATFPPHAVDAAIPMSDVRQNV
jgi:hypothetical protein